MLNLTPQISTLNYPMRTLLYGPPKVGKTTAISLLPGHYVMELERGGGSYCNLAFNEYLNPEQFAAGLLDLQTLKREHPESFPKFLVVDTADKLEDLAAIRAMNYYNKRFPKSKLETSADLMDLEYAAGYNHLRNAFTYYMDCLDELGIPIIYLAHVRTKAIDKSVQSVDVKDISLSLGVSKNLCSACNLIGFLLRNKRGELIMSCRPEQQVNCGSHINRLSGRDIPLVTSEGGKLVGHWQEIFPQLAPVVA